MKKIISALLLLTSCTHGIDQLPVQEIDFTPEFTAQVKGTATTDEILMNKGFGVFAATGKIGAEGNNAFAADGELKSFMNNVPVRNQNGSWVADPVHYWPDGYDVSFFAYAPYIGQLTSEADWTGKQVSLTYTPDPNPKNHHDLMVAQQPALDKFREQVKFSFQHVLTKVTFSAAYVGNIPSTLPSDTYIRIDELELKGLLGTNKIVLNKDGWSWDTEENAVPDASYKISINSSTLSGAALNQNKDVQNPVYTNFVLPDGEMYLLPQTISSGQATVGVTFSFVSGNNIHAQFYSEKPLPECAFQSFEAVRFNLTLDISTASLIKVVAVNNAWIEEWVESDNPIPEVKPEII